MSVEDDEMHVCCVLSCFAVILGVGLLDYYLSPELNASILYLLPIAFCARRCGRRVGLAAATFGAGVWLIAELASVDYSRPYGPYWNGASHLTVFGAVAILAARARQSAEVSRSSHAWCLPPDQGPSSDKEPEVESLKREEAVLRRLGHDLHDILGQDIAGLALLSGELEERLAARHALDASLAARLKDHSNQLIRRVRAMIHGLCIPNIERSDLSEALAELAQDASAFFGVRCEFADRSFRANLPPAHLLHLYRISQEAITNAVKHGAAHSIVIRLSSEDGYCILRVEDDGRGLPTDGSSNVGLGVSIMRHRAAAMSGTMSLERRSPSGLAIVCRIPLPAGEVKS